MQVLSDPVRRQRYDAYRRASRQGIPNSAETMWDVAKDSLVDPLAIASLEVLQKTTDLNIGNPFKVAPQPRKWSARPQATPTPQASSSPQPDPSNEVTDQVEYTAELPPPSIQAPAPEPAVPSFTPEVQATPEPAPPPPPPNDVVGIAARYGMDGRFLRAVRELRKRTLEELADETRISLRYLHALESNDFDSLPAATFVRGYVKELSRALDIQDVDVVESYLGLYKQQRG
jgi:hypothetical protein